MVSVTMAIITKVTIPMVTIEIVSNIENTM